MSWQQLLSLLLPLAIVPRFLEDAARSFYAAALALALEGSRKRIGLWARVAAWGTVGFLRFRKIDRQQLRRFT